MLKTKKPTREDAKDIVLKLFDRTDRPVLVGPACIALGPYWGLSATEGLFSEMVMQGLIRVVTDAERKSFDCRTGYLLVKDESPAPAVSHVRATGERPSQPDLCVGFDD